MVTSASVTNRPAIAGRRLASWSTLVLVTTLPSMAHAQSAATAVAQNQRCARELRVERFRVPSRAWTERVVVDRSGGIYMTGYDSRESEPKTLTRVDREGVVVWQLRLMPVAMNVWDMAAHPDGGVVMLAQLQVDLGDRAMDDREFLVRVDASGRMLWRRQLPRGELPTHNLAVSEQGDIAVALQLRRRDVPSGVDFATWVARFDRDGRERWSRTGDIDGSTLDAFVTIDERGAVYVATTSVVIADPPGERLHDARPVRSVLPVLTAFTPDGRPTWRRALGGVGDVSPIALRGARSGFFMAGSFFGTFDAGRGVMHAGASPGYRRAFVAAYDAEGHAIWSRALGADDGRSGTEASAFVQDAAGRLLVGMNFYGVADLEDGCGGFPSSRGRRDVLVAEISTAGEVLTSHVLVNPDVQWLEALAVMPDGTLVASRNGSRWIDLLLGEERSSQPTPSRTVSVSREEH